MVYFDLEHALDEQRKIIEISGGLHGCRDPDQLSATIEFVKDDEYYKTLDEKVSYILYSVSKNHVFVDGNKRTSIALASYFLEINGYGERVGNFIVQMEDIIVWTVKNKVSRDLLKRIVESLIKSGDLSESLQLELIEAMS